MLILTVAGCASLLGPRTVEISQGELLEKLSGQFPLTQRVLHVLDVQALSPRLSLQPQANRVTATVPLVARDLLRSRDAGLERRPTRWPTRTSAPWCCCTS